MRLIVPVLLVANLIALAWWQGWLDPWAGAQRQPERFARQIEPQVLRIVPIMPGGAFALPGDTGDTGLPVPSDSQR